MLTGRVHSFESCGTVDGPGIRFIVFMQGCRLRCVYCHNPDSWSLEGGREVTVDEVLEQAVKYKNFMRFSGGGITISGGEPLIQAEFVTELLRRCRSQGIHTAVDTAGSVPPEQAIPVFRHTDLVLLDIKCSCDELYRRMTGGKLSHTLANAEYLAAENIPVWLRHVLVPGLTDDRDLLERLAAYAAGLGNVQKVEILPFHQIGSYKWQAMGVTYPLEPTLPPTPEQVAAAVEIFRSWGLDARS